MKKLFLFWMGVFFILCLESCIVSTRPNIAFFNSTKAASDAQIMSYNIPLSFVKPYIKSSLKKEENSEALIAMIKKVKKIKVMTLENGNKKLLTDFYSYLSENHYTQWITINNGEDNINIQTIQDGENIKKLMLCVKNDNQMVFVDIRGSFSPEDISHVINVTEKNSTLIKKTTY